MDIGAEARHLSIIRCIHRLVMSVLIVGMDWEAFLSPSLSLRARKEQQEMSGFKV
jgi:hypothetical protein